MPRLVEQIWALLCVCLTISATSSDLSSNSNVSSTPGNSSVIPSPTPMNSTSVPSSSDQISSLSANSSTPTPTPTAASLIPTNSAPISASYSTSSSISPTPTPSNASLSFPQGCYSNNAQSCTSCTAAHQEQQGLGNAGCFWCDGAVAACLPYSWVSLCTDPIASGGFAGLVLNQSCPEYPSQFNCGLKYCDCENCTLDTTCQWCDGASSCMAKAAGSDTLCPLLGGTAVASCASCPGAPACQTSSTIEYCYQRRFSRRCLDLAAQSCEQCTQAHEEVVFLNDTDLGCFWCDGRIRACLPYFLADFQLRLDEAVCAADLNANPIVPGLAGNVYYQNCTQPPKYKTCQDRHCDCNNCTLDPACFWCPGYNLCFDNISASLLACAFLGNNLIKTCDACPPVALPAGNISDSAQCIGPGESILTCPGLDGVYFEAGCLDLKAQSCGQCALAHVETVARNSSGLGCFWCEGRIRACLPYYLPEVDLHLADAICVAPITGGSLPGLNGTAYNQTCTPKLFNTCQDRHCDCESCALDPACSWCPGINLCFDDIPATPYACAFLGGSPISACTSCPNASSACSGPAPAPGAVTCGAASVPPALSSSPASVTGPAPAPVRSGAPPSTVATDACIDPGNRCDEGYLCIDERCQPATTSYTSGAPGFCLL